MGSKDKIIKRAFFILGLLIFSMLLISQMNWFWRLLFPIEYEDLIIASAQKYQLDPSLVAAIVFVESKYIEPFKTQNSKFAESNGQVQNLKPN